MSVLNIRPYSEDSHNKPLDVGPFATDQVAYDEDQLHISKVTKKGQRIENNAAASKDLIASEAIIHDIDIVSAANTKTTTEHPDAIDVDAGESGGTGTPTTFRNVKVRRPTPTPPNSPSGLPAVWSDSIITKRSHSLLRMDNCRWDGTHKVTAQKKHGESVGRVEFVNGSKGKAKLWDGCNLNEVYADASSIGQVIVQTDTAGKVTVKPLPIPTPPPDPCASLRAKIAEDQLAISRLETAVQRANQEQERMKVELGRTVSELVKAEGVLAQVRGIVG